MVLLSIYRGSGSQSLCKYMMPFCGVNPLIGIQIFQEHNIAFNKWGILKLIIYDMWNFYMHSSNMVMIVILLNLGMEHAISPLNLSESNWKLFLMVDDVPIWINHFLPFLYVVLDMEPLIISLCIIVILKLWNLKSDKWVIGGAFFVLVAQHSRAHELLSLEQCTMEHTLSLKWKGKYYSQVVL